MTTLAEIARKGAAVRAIAIAIAIAITKNATSFFMKPKILTELRDAPVYFSPALVRVEDAGERPRVDFAAAHHADDLLSCDPIAQLHRRRERRRTGTFGEIVRRAQRKADAGGELVFGERHDIVERANASAFCACTPMTFARLPRPLRTIEQPHAPLPPPIGTRMTSTSGICSR